MLAEKGLDLVFLDGTCIVTYPTWPVVDKMTGRVEFSEENAEKTFRAVARISERDAETSRFIFEKFRTKWLPALSEVTYNQPRPWGEKDAAEMFLNNPDSGVEPVHAVMTVE